MTSPAPAETPQEWAERVRRERGPMPQRVVDHINRLRTQHAVTVPTKGKRTA